MRGYQPVRALATAVPAAAAIVLLAGCRAFDVGAPSVDRRTRTVYDTSSSPTRSVATAVRMTRRSEGTGAVTVGLEADIRDEYARTSRQETTTVTTRRHLAFGLFPAAAEQYCAPDGADRSPCFKRPYPAAFVLGLPFVPIGTLRSLLWELPFGSYDCSKDKAHDAFSHVGLLGFHKFTTTVRKGPDYGPTVTEPPQVRTRTALAVPGPFSIEFSIPEENYRPPAATAGRDGRATFSLPSVSRDRTVKAYVAFRASSAPSGYGSEDWARGAVAQAAAQTHAFDITLRAPPSKPKPEPKPYVPPPRPQPPPPPPKPYEVIGIDRTADGKFIVRLEIKDKSKTLQIIPAVRPEVKDLVRNDYAEKHPYVPSEFIFATVEPETEGRGDVLVFTGLVFSVQPVKTDGWRYDAESRSGWVKLRIEDGISADEAKRWARENISAIVADKNVLVGAGTAPPPGATYRSLGETFENGLLTVEFQAVQ